MHASSLENMLLAFEYYVSEDYFNARQSIRVVGHRRRQRQRLRTPISLRTRNSPTRLSICKQAKVSIWCSKTPIPTLLRTVELDIIISGQAFEHVEFLLEILRRDDAGTKRRRPSASHRPLRRPNPSLPPVDCYRFYPDAYQALARWTKTELLEVWRDERGPWRDLCGVFAKQKHTGAAPTPHP